MSFRRADQFAKLKDSYDLCIIGGGATGAGVALDATLRGYSVLLIEKGDFACQTSSKSTKLVHGGVRYLEQAVRNLDWQQFKMVYKALHERKIILQNAPHLAHPLALLTPCYSWWDRVYYRIGMWLYDKIAGSTNLEDSRGLGLNQIKKEVPGLETNRIKGGILYYDGQLDDARYALSILQEAERLGATVINYCELTSFFLSPKSLKIKQVYFKDLLGKLEHAVAVRAVVNATGPYTDAIRKMANPKLGSRMKVSRGAHIVLPKSFWPSEMALLIPKTDDGRVVFLIPWRGFVLVGTTDDPDVISDQPEILEEEKIYLLEYFNRFAKQKASMSDISSHFVGQRPLLQVQLNDALQTDTKSLVRDHEVEVDQRSKLVSIMGGKWTTYRVMASDTMDVVETEVFHVKKSVCQTQHHALGISDSVNFVQEVHTGAMSADTEKHLKETYGGQARFVWEFCQKEADGIQLLDSKLPYLLGEIQYLKEFEMATSWDDVLKRRWGIALRDEGMASRLKAIKKEAFASYN
jgi:glycerol-3-phosphate dehydrogenase